MPMSAVNKKKKIGLIYTWRYASREIWNPVRRTCLEGGFLFLHDPQEGREPSRLCHKMINPYSGSKAFQNSSLQTQLFLETCPPDPWDHLPLRALQKMRQTRNAFF